jgi:hypothetical protein
MNKLDDLLTIPTMCLIVVLAVLTLLLRKLAEAIWPTLSSATPSTVAERVWEEFALPAIPAVLGTLFCALVPPTLYPYPPMVIVTPLSRVLYGFTLGWFSSGGYRGISAVLKKKWNVSLPGDTDPPPRINGTGNH